MKAGIYLGQRNVQIKEVELPQLGENDVLIKNIYSSICGTDVAVYNHGPNTGHKVDVGGEFGHEMVSRVAAVGRNVKDFKVGERVYPYPRYVKDDTRRAGTIGGFSEYILAVNAKKNYSLYEVDDKISDRLASLIEPFTVGCRAARRGMPKAGENAVVFGCGTIGLAAAVSLKYFGADKIMVCDLSDYRLRIAEKLGFEICNMGTENFADKAMEYLGAAESLNGTTANADIFLDAAGAEEILDLFIKEGKIESRFVSVAVNNSLRKLDLLHMTYAQKMIIGSGGYMPEDVIDVMSIMASGRWDLEQLITHEYPLNELSEAIETASDVEHACNVVIHF